MAGMSEHFRDRRFERLSDGTWRAVPPALTGHVDAEAAPIEAQHKESGAPSAGRHYAFCAAMAVVIGGSMAALGAGRIDWALALFLLGELGALIGLLFLEGAP